MLFRLFQWAYYRHTGDVWSPSMRMLCARPTLRWAFTGRDTDAAGSSIADAFAEGLREGLRTPSVFERDMDADGYAESDDEFRDRIKREMARRG